MASNGPKYRAFGNRILDLPSEQLVGFARLAFSGFAYLAIYLDPAQPTRYGGVTYGILFAYFVYSGLLTVLALRGHIHGRGQVATHLIDIAIFSVLMSFTDGPTSPFFVFFTFALVAATLRWNWPAAVGTAIGLVALLVAVGYFDMQFSGDADYELNRTIIRSSYLLLVGGLLGYVSAIRQRNRKRLEKLAAWPEEEHSGDTPSIARSLRHAADVIGAQRVLVLWDNGEEPHTAVAHWTGEVCEFTKWEDTDLISLLDRAGTAAFVAPKALAGTLVLASGRYELPAPLLPAEFCRTFMIERFACAGVAGERVRSWTLLLDPPSLSEELFSLAEIVSARIGAELTAFSMRQELTRAAVARERARLARNMHDGILQNLTAATLQLKTLAPGLPMRTAARIKELTELLGGQQQMIREFVQAVNPKSRIANQPQELAPQVRAFAKRVSEQWNCSIATEVSPPDLCVSARLVAELWLMISEGVANAVRHGAATSIAVSIVRDREGLNVRFWDNGSGLASEEQQRGDTLPVSLNERVKDLGGTLSLEQSTAGYALDIRLPLS